MCNVFLRSARADYYLGAVLPAWRSPGTCCTWIGSWYRHVNLQGSQQSTPREMDHDYRINQRLDLTWYLALNFVNSFYLLH